MAAQEEKSFCVLDYHTRQSVVTVQRAFRAKYAKGPPTDKTVLACYKRCTETGRLCKQKSSGRSLAAEDDVERVRASFLHSPKKSTGTATFSLFLWLWTIPLKLVVWFFVINVCNHVEHYKTPCTVFMRDTAMC